MDGIQITIEKAGVRQDISIVKILGYIDTTTSSELERVIQNLLREQRYRIIIDLQNVDYISSAGWGIFISEIKNIRTHHGDLKLACMSESVNEVYELLEFSTILVAMNSVADALKAFESQEGASEPAPAASKAPATPAPAASRPASVPASAIPAQARPVTPAATAPARPVAPAGSKPAAPVVAPASAVRAAAPAPMAPAVVAAAVPTEAKSVPVLLNRIQAVIRSHPDWGAWSIKNELNRNRGNQPKVGWGDVGKELKKNSLQTKAERIKYSQGA